MLFHRSFLDAEFSALLPLCDFLVMSVLTKLDGGMEELFER